MRNNYLPAFSCLTDSCATFIYIALMSLWCFEPHDAMLNATYEHIRNTVDGKTWNSFANDSVIIPDPKCGGTIKVRVLTEN